MQKKDIYKYMDLCMFYIIMFKKKINKTSNVDILID